MSGSVQEAINALAQDWMIKISNLEEIGAAEAAKIYRMCRKDLLSAVSKIEEIQPTEETK